MPTENFTLLDKLSVSVKNFSDQTVFQLKQSEGYIEHSYGDLYDRSREIGQLLVGFGINPGDRIAIAMENRPEWVFVYFGILFVGAIAVPIDPNAAYEDFLYFLEHSQSRILFTSVKYCSVIGAITDHMVIPPTMVLMDQDESKRDIKTSVLSLYEFISGDKKSIDNITALPDDVVSIIYTSGTTDKPKGVMLSHSNLYFDFTSVIQAEGFSFNYNALAILPFHHIFPFVIIVLVSIFQGGKISFIKTIDREEVLRSLREDGVTVFVSVPQYFYHLYQAIFGRIASLPFITRVMVKGVGSILYGLRKLTGINLSKLFFYKVHKVFGDTLKYFACGGAYLDQGAELGLTKLGFSLIQGYGLTETAAVSTLNPIDKPMIGSAGKAIPNVNVKIINPDQNDIGEIIISGPNVTKGYYRSEKDTAESIKDGWLYTGDLGRFDKEGYLFITGRKKELIVLGSGKNISPEEVELHYTKGSYIKELCVLAVDQGEQERLVAVIVPDFDFFKKTGELDVYNTIKLELEIYSKGYPMYKSIMGFVVTKDDLPRTRLGKLKRYEVREKYLSKLLGGEVKKSEAESLLSEDELNILASPVYQALVDLILKEKQQITSPIYLNDHLGMDLGIDSLGMIELLVLIEKRFKVDIPKELLAKIATVKELFMTVNQLFSETASGDFEKVVYSQHKLWQEILANDPPSKVLDKIILEPNLIYKTVGWFLNQINWIASKLLWRVTVKGLGNIPKNEAVVLCANHASFLDAFVMFSVLPGRVRRAIFYMGYYIYFDVLGMNTFVKLARVIPIDPATNLVEAMQACSYILKHKKFLAIFPEGRRSVDGKIQSFKKGVGILAEELNVKLIPVYIDGSFEAWPMGQKFPKAKPIRVNIGEPFSAEQLKEKGNALGIKDDYEAIAKGLEEEVKRVKSGLGDMSQAQT